MTMFKKRDKTESVPVNVSKYFNCDISLIAKKYHKDLKPVGVKKKLNYSNFHERATLIQCNTLFFFTVPSFQLQQFPASIYLLKVNKRNG